MSVVSMMNQAASILRQSGETRGPAGSVVQEYEEEEFMGYFEPQPPINLQGEDIENRNTQMGRWIGLCPPTLAFTGWDVIVYEDQVMDLIGPPRPMWNPRLGAVSHKELSLRIVE